MPKFYQHREDLTYYTKVNKGGVATLQIAPRGADYLKSRGYRLEQDIMPWDMQVLNSMGWLYTKGEMPGLGFIDGYLEPSPHHLTSRWFTYRTGTYEEIQNALMRWVAEIEGTLGLEIARSGTTGALKAREAASQLTSLLKWEAVPAMKFLTGVEGLIPKLHLAAKSMSVEGLSELRIDVHEVPELPCSWRDVERAEKIFDSLRGAEAQFGKYIKSQGSTPVQFERRVLTAVIVDEPVVESPSVFTPPQPDTSTPLKFDEPLRPQTPRQTPVRLSETSNATPVAPPPQRIQPPPPTPGYLWSEVKQTSRPVTKSLPAAPTKKHDGKTPKWVIVFAVAFLLCLVISTLS